MRRGLATRWADEDLPRVSEGLQPGSGVHHGADSHLLVFGDGREIDERVAGLDADAHVKQYLRCRLARRPIGAGAGGTEGAFGVVGVSGRCAEQDEDGVADVLLDRPAVRGENVLKVPECALELALHAFGSDAYRQVRRANDIDEETCDEPPLGMLFVVHCANDRTEPAWGGRPATRRARTPDPAGLDLRPGRRRCDRQHRDHLDRLGILGFGIALVVAEGPPPRSTPATTPPIPGRSWRGSSFLRSPSGSPGADSMRMVAALSPITNRRAAHPGAGAIRSSSSRMQYWAPIVVIRDLWALLGSNQ
ncbi:MAG TPA: hypothetical protein VKR80_03405 [Candidatus Limnocylindria bacterium]|nr:hypothetical protein [Candidatus Limnocylindria bacterium]